MNDNDFKYVVQDLSSVQLGARYNYEELLLNDRVPFKFQSIIRLYLFKEASQTDEIGAHILRLKDSDICYEVLRQLRIKIKFYEPKVDESGFQQKVMKLPEFMKYKEESWTEQHMIHEVIISSLALMTFTV